MAIQLSDLLAAPTEDELTDLILAAMVSEGFPVTSWRVGGVARTLVKLVVKGCFDLAGLVSTVTAGGLLTYSSGGWLTLLAAQVYQCIRAEATLAQGTLRLDCSISGGPYTITPGQLTFSWLSAEGVKYYKNTDGGVLASGGTLALTFQAQEAGSDHNAPDAGIDTIVTPLAGVTIRNDPFFFNGVSRITTQGTDEETDAALKARCLAKWGATGSAANEDGYEYWARTASAEITRVRAAENVPSDGHVTVTLASATGAPTGGAVTAVDEYINGPPTVRRPLCVTVHVAAAAEQAIPLTATIYVRAGSNPNASAQAAAALAAYQATLDIAGVSGGYTVTGGVTVFLSQIIEELQTPTGVINSVVTAPAADVDITAGSVPVFSPISLTVVLV